MWRFRGLTHYLGVQGERLGVSRVLVSRARHNGEANRISTLIGQLCERYHRLPRDGGVILLNELNEKERTQIRGTLSQCEDELAKLRVVVAATQVMIDEACAAFGESVPERQVKEKRNVE